MLCGAVLTPGVWCVVAAQWDPNFEYEAGKASEEQIRELFLALSYKWMPSKSALQSVGAQHTWPSLLAALVWLIEEIEVRRALASASPSAFRCRACSHLLQQRWAAPWVGVRSHLVSFRIVQFRSAVSESELQQQSAEENPDRLFYRHSMQAYTAFLAGKEDEQKHVEDSIDESFSTQSSPGIDHRICVLGVASLTRPVACACVFRWAKGGA